MTTKENKYAGSIPDVYEQYLVPLLFDPYARDLAQRVKAVIPDDGAVLETAGGTGVVAKYLRQALPDTTRLVVTDLNPAMLAVAEQQLGNGNNTEFKTANGSELPFDDDSFDAVFCQFGVMFFPDIVQGYREAARVLKPGGAFIFNVWEDLGKNDFSRAVHEAALKLDEDNPPDFLALPFVYNYSPTVLEQLKTAGFNQIETDLVPHTSRAASARDVALALAAGSPLATQLAERGLGEEAIDNIESELVREFGDDEVSAPMMATVITAKV